MAPAVAQFESDYKSKVNIVEINIDQKETPEFKKHEALLQRTRGIPFTVWVDSKGDILAEQVGSMSAADLGRVTEESMKKAK